MTVLVGEILNRLTKVLEEAGVDAPRLDARLLIAAAMERDPKDILLHTSLFLSDSQHQTLEDYSVRRCAGEPVSRICGEREFWGLLFKLSSSTLDPRPDSETLISALLSLKADVQDHPQHILDVGTGTGCLLLSLLSEWPSAWGMGLDVEFGAVSTARSNALRLGLKSRANFVVGDWLSSLDMRFDIIVSNPPYICSATIADLHPEVRLYDPLKALDGGLDGLAAFRHLIPQSAHLLAPSGALALEVGAGQSEDVAAILEESGFVHIGFHKDLAGYVRCVTARASQNRSSI